MKTLNVNDIKLLVRNALAEDIGSGDATTLAAIPKDVKANAVFITRENCTCSGLNIAKEVFRELDSSVIFNAEIEEGDSCSKGTILAKMSGPARALLTAERTALNFLQHMCGIATKTRSFVNEIKNPHVKILDTRKTLPGLRMIEKYAVFCGGGTNHRVGLWDRIMIKDNHRYLASLDGAGGITRSVKACRTLYPNLEIEVEADTLLEVEEAANAGAEYILLDNMTNDEITEAVSINNSRSLLEVSGNVSLNRVASLSTLGIDFISVGALTHSVRAIDISLDIEIES